MSLLLCVYSHLFTQNEITKLDYTTNIYLDTMALN